MFLRILLMFSLLFIVGCAKKPVEELASAEAAVKEAVDAGAPALAPDAYESAENKLLDGKELVSSKKYKKAVPVLEECVALAQEAVKLSAEARLAEAKRKEALAAEVVHNDVREYTVVRGDCLWFIAGRELGDSYRWVDIYRGNRDKIGSNPDLIYPLQVFVLP